MIMMLTGINDSLRGIFIPIFQSHFSLSATQSSLIITMSYAGNLLFLLFGGYFIDSVERKTAILSILTLWTSSLVIFVCTDNFYALLIGMFIAMGTSTLLSTSINLLIPFLFAATPGLVMNALCFTQGIGTSGSQKLIGTYSSGFSSWHHINLFMICVAVLAFFLLCTLPIPSKEKKNFSKKEKIQYGAIIKNRAFIYLVFIFGFYFIAEHGIMNWLVSYCHSELGYSMSSSSTYLSIFFGGITIGRLIFSPFIDRLGVFKSISISGFSGMLLYVIGALLGRNFIILLSLSGFLLSIIYPTLVLMIRSFYPVHTVATATGTIISVATLFDIGFNLSFGMLIDTLGFKFSFYILPISIVAFYLCYVLFRKNIRTAVSPSVSSM